MDFGIVTSAATVSKKTGAGSPYWVFESCAVANVNQVIWLFTHVVFTFGMEL